MGSNYQMHTPAMPVSFQFGSATPQGSGAPTSRPRRGLSRVEARPLWADLGSCALSNLEGAVGSQFVDGGTGGCARSFRWSCFPLFVFVTDLVHTKAIIISRGNLTFQKGGVNFIKRLSVNSKSTVHFQRWERAFISPDFGWTAVTSHNTNRL